MSTERDFPCDMCSNPFSFPDTIFYTLQALSIQMLSICTTYHGADCVIFKGHDIATDLRIFFQLTDQTESVRMDKAFKCPASGNATHPGWNVSVFGVPRS